VTLLSEVNADVVAGYAAFLEAVVAPLEQRNRDVLEDHTRLYDKRGAYSPEVDELLTTVRMSSAEAGYYTMFCPTGIGGGGLGSRAMLETYEHLFRTYGAGRPLMEESIAHWATGPSFLCEAFSEDLKARLLGDIMSGAVSMCFGMSEPNAGSDIWMMATTAVQDGDEWVINGSKQWTTNSPLADYCYLFAVTDPELHRERRGGISCFVVPMTADGAAVDSVIRIFGQPGGNEGILSFVDVRVPNENLVGALGDGHKLALGGVSLGRVFNSARGIGLSRWALEIAVEYAKSRQTFGRAIAQHQGVSFKLAESAMDIYAARSAAYDLADQLDRGEKCIRELAMTKAICVEACLRVTDRCMQVCGAMGLTNELRMYRAWHDARALQLADGSGEILRDTIVKRLLKGEIGF
jgi:acyl-CoA dehydrogenase